MADKKIKEQTKSVKDPARERADFILKRASVMLQAKEVYSRNWAEYERLFKMALEGRTGRDKWRADLPDTWSFATIKTAQAAFVDSKVIPTIIRHEDDPTSKAQDLKDLYIDIAEKGNLDHELYFIRLDAFKLGNGYGKTIYVKDTRTIWEIEEFNPETNEFKWKKREINEFDDPKTTRISPYLILVDDLARADWNSVRDCIEVEVMGRDEAEARYEHLVNFKDIPATTYLLQQLKGSSKVNIAETDGRGLRGTEFENLAHYQFFAPGFDWSDDMVEILHYENVGIKTPSGALDSKEILINGHPVQVDLKTKPSPIPYIHKQLSYFHVPYSPYSGDEHYAAGIIEIGLAEARAIRKHREMMSDRQKISLFSPAFSDVNDEIDQRNLALEPFLIIRTRGGVPHQFQIPGATNADFVMQDRHEASYKRAVGVDERILGVAAEGIRLTATEVSFLREAALKRLREFSFLYKNALLHQEVKKKLSLFKQYFSSPFTSEPKTKSDRGIRSLKNKFKEFKIRVGNTYVKKEISPNYFEGEVDVDLDLELLMPLTQTQQVTIWAQILRDTVPFVQAGIIDVSLKKIWEKYIEAFGRNPDALKEDAEAHSIEMAEAEHKLYADPNSSKHMSSILPDGTQPPELTQAHILKHEELLDADMEMKDAEKARLIEHIKLDIENLKKLQAQQAQPNLQVLTPQAIGGVGGLQGTPQAPMQPQAQPQMQ